MSRLLPLFCFFFVIPSAFASDVAKPENTREPAFGVATINKMPVKYSVMDEGWRIAGTLYPPEDFELVGQKAFFIQYEDAEKLAMNVLEADAHEKCTKLGTLEKAAQTSGFNDQSKIISTSEVTGKNPYARGFRCTVTIEVFKTVDACLARFMRALSAGGVSLPKGIDSMARLNEELARLSGGGIQITEGEVCGLK